MTAKETQSYLNISRTALYELLKEPTFPSIKANNTWNIDRSKLRKWIETEIKRKDETKNDKG